MDVSPLAGGKSSREQALAAPLVGSECPGSSGGKRVAPVYVEELCFSTSVTHIAQMAEHWYGFPADLGLIPGLGP